MILASCIENHSGLAEKRGYGMITLAEGGVRVAFDSSSLVSVLRTLSSSTRSGLRTIPALRAYISPTKDVEGTCMLQGVITWKDAIHSLEAQYASSGCWEASRATKTSTAQVAHLVFRQVLLSVVGELTAPDPKALHRSILPSSIPPLKQAGDVCIPSIIVTPPTSAPSQSASPNTVPTPQDAAFGNQLTVPDPEFQVINAYHQDLWLDKFGLDADYAFDSFGGASSPSWGDMEMGEQDVTVTCVPWEEESEGEDAGALSLGPTWSG